MHNLVIDQLVTARIGSSENRLRALRGRQIRKARAYVSVVYLERKLPANWLGSPSPSIIGGPAVSPNVPAESGSNVIPKSYSSWPIAWPQSRIAVGSVQGISLPLQHADLI